MFSHIMLGASDLERSRRFYDAFLGALGIAPGVVNKNSHGTTRYFYRHDGNTFAITTPLNGQSASAGNGSTFGFAAASPQQAETAHAAGVAAGGSTCEDPPGWRETPRGPVYLAYLRDPDGNKLCALHRKPA